MSSAGLSLAHYNIRGNQKSNTSIVLYLLSIISVSRVKYCFQVILTPFVNKCAVYSLIIIVCFRKNAQIVPILPGPY